MDILDDMGVSKLPAKVYFKSELLNHTGPAKLQQTDIERLLIHEPIIYYKNARQNS